MNELEQLKKSAEFGRSRLDHPMYQSSDVTKAMWMDTLEFLDRVIVIAAKSEQGFADCWSSHQAQKLELDQARADVLRHRDFTESMGDYFWFIDGVKLMADTEHYEQYR